MTFDPFRGTSYSAEVVQQTAAQWVNTGNFVLQSYQIGIETDTGKAKMGDGTSDWDTLSYWNPTSGGVKVYTALLTQTGTDAPVATVLENTLGGEVVWTRSDPGFYYGTLLEAFPLGQTVVIAGGTATSDAGAVIGAPADGDYSSVVVKSSTLLGVLADSQLLRTTIEIRVYP